jgi:hypothetical protein
MKGKEERGFVSFEKLAMDWEVVGLGTCRRQGGIPAYEVKSWNLVDVLVCRE